MGEGQAAVRRYYRNYSIVEQARDKFQLNTSRVEENFGIFDRGMTGGVRAFINAPIPSAVRERQVSTAKRRRDKAKGARGHPLDLWGRALDTGDLRVAGPDGDLSVALSSDDGIETLRRTGNLADAKEAARGGSARLIARLSEAQTALRAALQDIEAHATDPAVRNLVSECRDALTDLDEMISAEALRLELPRDLEGGDALADSAEAIRCSSRSVTTSPLQNLNSESVRRRMPRWQRAFCSNRFVSGDDVRLLPTRSSVSKPDSDGETRWTRRCTSFFCGSPFLNRLYAKSANTARSIVTSIGLS